MSLANQLTNIAVWLENGCEPAMAAQELRKITNALWTPCLNEDGDAEMREHPDGAFVLLSDCSPPDMPTAAAPAGLSAEPTREPSAIQRVCHALTGGCVMITDPERAACTSENCLAMRAAENR